MGQFGKAIKNPQWKTLHLIVRQIPVKTMAQKCFKKRYKYDLGNFPNTTSSMGCVGITWFLSGYCFSLLQKHSGNFFFARRNRSRLGIYRKQLKMQFYSLDVVGRKSLKFRVHISCPSIDLIFWLVWSLFSWFLIYKRQPSLGNPRIHHPSIQKVKLEYTIEAAKF